MLYNFDRTQYGIYLIQNLIMPRYSLVCVYLFCLVVDSRAVFWWHLNTRLKFKYFYHHFSHLTKMVFIPEWYYAVLVSETSKILNLNALTIWMAGGQHNTVGIQLSDMSGNRMAKSSPIAKWFINWMVTWIVDKKSGSRMVHRCLYYHSVTRLFVRYSGQHLVTGEKVW